MKLLDTRTGKEITVNDYLASVYLRHNPKRYKQVKQEEKPKTRGRKPKTA